MLLKLYEENPNEREIQKIVDTLRNGGVIIYPTDTVYGIGCDITNHKALERLARIKGVSLEKANFSFICYDLSHLSDYTRQVSNRVFKLMRHYLPGPFTFILEANNNVPKIFKNKKKTVGIRIPDNNICREIVKALGNPIVSTSIHDIGAIVEYPTDPEEIHDRYGKLVDIVIDGGFGNNEASTVVNCAGDEISILRQGVGIIEID